MSLQHVLPEELTKNPFRMIGKEWMLITAEDPDTHEVNTMTASWGCVGVLWNKPVAVCFIRPQRHTHPIAMKASRLSLSVLPEAYREALRFCGTRSGRDCDKFERAGLTVATVDKAPIICEADTVIICRKLYSDDIRYERFADASIVDKVYAKGDTHRFYVCEIEKILRKI